LYGIDLAETCAWCCGTQSVVWSTYFFSV